MKRSAQDLSPVKRFKSGNALAVAAAAAAASTISERSQDSLTLRLIKCSEILKENNGPMTIHDLEMSIGYKIDSQLLSTLAQVDRIDYNEEEKTLYYHSLHNIKTAEDLMKVLKKQQAFLGLQVKQLKDGWNECIPTIRKLEKNNEILVNKTKKDQTPKHIWLNVEKLHLLQEDSETDKSFADLWHKIEIPDHETLVKKLIENKIKPTNVDSDALKNKNSQPVKQQKKRKSRKGKITNTHLKGILRDYSKMR